LRVKTVVTVADSRPQMRTDTLSLGHVNSAQSNVGCGRFWKT